MPTCLITDGSLAGQSTGQVLGTDDVKQDTLTLLRSTIWVIAAVDISDSILVLRQSRFGSLDFKPKSDVALLTGGLQRLSRCD